MGIATGMITGIVECLNLVVEWHTPNEGKKAATGKIGASKGQIIAAMEERFPKLKEVTVLADKEHIADACACMLAAKDGNLVRMLREYAHE